MSWRELMAKLANADPAERARIISKIPFADLLRYDAEFEAWSHRNQLPPDDDGWTTWLMMAGRGFGKTRAGAEWIHGLALARPGSRIALVGASMIEARSIMVEGVSGILSVAHNRGKKVGWEPSLGRLKWSNGSEAQLFSGDSPEGLRGPEHDYAWCDELAKWRDADATWDNLQFVVALKAEDDGAGGLAIRWTRRSRKGWAWLDEVGAPLGETREMYRLTLNSATGSIERTVDEPALGLALGDLAPLGAVPWTLLVRQLGEQAASHPAFLQIS